MQLLKAASIALVAAIGLAAGSAESLSQPTRAMPAQTSPPPVSATNAAHWVTVASSVAQVIGALVNMGLFIYVVVFAKALREAIRGRHLDGMKYVWGILSTPEAVKLRRWVIQDLRHEPKPLSDDAIEKVRRIGRDFDHIGLLCRKDLLPADIIATTYNQNIREMWSELEQPIKALRLARKDDDYFAEFEWLAKLADQKEAAHQERVRQVRFPDW